MSEPVLETVDLVLCDVAEADLEAIVAVRRSNPERLARTEGTEAGPGVYDRAMLERDLTIVGFDPARSFLAARRRGDGRVVGYVDLLDAHPDDGRPWLGTVEIAAADQGQGYGRQCVEAVARRARDALQANGLRTAVDVDDHRCLAFFEHLGFATLSKVERPSPLGRIDVVVFELAFGP